MIIDYNKLITIKSILSIDEERLSELKNIANNERNYIINKNVSNHLTQVLTQKAHDIAYASSRYDKLTKEEKGIIAANIVFDDNKFVSILNKGKFELSSLELYLKLLNYMQYKVANNMISTEDDKRYLNTANIYAKKLMNHFNKYVGEVDAYLIINKLTEIVVHNKDLLSLNNKKHNR